MPNISDAMMISQRHLQTLLCHNIHNFRIKAIKKKKNCNRPLIVTLGLPAFYFMCAKKSWYVMLIKQCFQLCVVIVGRLVRIICVIRRLFKSCILSVHGYKSSHHVNKTSFDYK